MGGDWIARDAAHVWHGFTQMSTYADNAPIIVERADGHEVIDVDGRRYLDAISSLWVNTLGHQVPELDDAAAPDVRIAFDFPDAGAVAVYVVENQSFAQREIAEGEFLGAQASDDRVEQTRAGDAEIGTARIQAGNGQTFFQVELGEALAELVE